MPGSNDNIQEGILREQRKQELDRNALNNSNKAVRDFKKASDGKGCLPLMVIGLVVAATGAAVAIRTIA